MQLSKRTQYGLRAMICLADHYQRGFLQTKELAAREGLPTKFLESILSALTRGKFLTSKIGSTGGYRLARSPQNVSVADIVTRLEGNQLIEDEEHDEANERPGEIAVRLLSEQLSAALRQILTSTTLAQLTEQVSATTRGNQMYYI